MTKEEKEQFTQDAAIICREQAGSDKVEVYFIGWLIKDRMSIPYMKIRMRYNPEIEYYAMLDKTYNSEIDREYTMNLIEKKIKSQLYTYI